MGLMHASVIAMMDDVKLVALCEKNNLIRRFLKKTIPDVDIVEDILYLKDKQLDAIFVTTPPSSHYQIIKEILQKQLSKHVFTEKPLATNYKHAKELCHLASLTGCVNMVGYHRRFSVTFNKAKTLLDTHVIGTLHSCKAHAYSADFLGVKTKTQAIIRGGVLADSGCHMVDISDWLLGEIEATSAKIVSFLKTNTEDEAYINFSTKDGLNGKLDISWCKEGYRLPEMELVVTGEKGTIKVNEDIVQLVSQEGKIYSWYKHNLDDFVPYSIGGNDYQRQDAQFIKAILNGSSIQSSFYTASHVEHVIDTVRNMVYKSNT
jgi:predicted dehydrogenase